MNKITKFFVLAFAIFFACGATIAEAAPGTVSGGSSASGGRSGSNVSTSRPRGGRPSTVTGGTTVVVTSAPATVSGGSSASTSGAPSTVTGGSSASTSGAPSTVTGGSSAGTTGVPGTVSGGSSAGTAGAPGTVSGGSSAGTTGPSTIPGGSSAGTGSNSGPSTIPGGSSAGTDTTNPTTPSTGTVSSGGGGSRGGSSGSVVSSRITDVLISKVGNNQIRVSFNTTPNAQGQLVWGTTSVKSLNGSTFYGYTNGSALDTATFNHVVTFTIAPNTTYFVRPVAKFGSGFLFGTEIALTPTAGSVSTTPSSRPATGIDIEGTIDVQPTMPGTENTGGVIATATSTDSTNTAAVAGTSFGTKIGNFFKNIWYSITAPICR